MFWKDEDRLLTHYVLGECAERQAAELEERLLLDEVFFQRLLLAEDELIDAYVHGELPVKRRLRFESAFLTSAERQRRVALARDLAIEGGNLGRKRGTVLASAKASGRSKAAAILAVAATGLLLIGLLTYWPEMETRLASDKTTSWVAAAPVMLVPTVRGGGAEIPRLELHPSARVAELQIYVGDQGTWDRFRARLETSGGREVWRLDAIAPGPGVAIDLAIPADTLRSAAVSESVSYTLTLEGDEGTGHYELIDEYPLRLIRSP